MMLSLPESITIVMEYSDGLFSIGIRIPLYRWRYRDVHPVLLWPQSVPVKIAAREFDTTKNCDCGPFVIYYRRSGSSLFSYFGSPDHLGR